MIQFAAVLAKTTTNIYGCHLDTNFTKENCKYMAKYIMVLPPKGIHPFRPLHRKNHSSDSPWNRLGQITSVQTVKLQWNISVVSR